MDSTVQNILLTVAGAVVGVLATVFGDEIKGWLGWTGYANRDLRGQWDCTWLVEWPETEVRQHLIDTVTVVRAGKREVLARGFIQGHLYNLRGSLSQANVLTLTFEVKAKPNLSGTVIVRLDTLRARFDGYWFQLGPTGSILGGATSWTRRAKA